MEVTLCGLAHDHVPNSLKRAKFDVARRRLQSLGPKGTPFIPPLISVKCNYCNQLIAPTLAKRPSSPSGGSIPPVSLHAGSLAGKAIPRYCLNCRKPLPRCSICLLTMGTPIYPSKTAFDASQTREKESAFDHWFTWCVTCSHGGHSNHILEWFETHSSCPVSGCNCNCQSSIGKQKIGR